MKLQKFNSIIVIGAIFIVSMYVGDMCRKAFLTTNQECPTCFVPQVQTDTMPLENGGEIVIKMVGEDKSVHMSYEDFEYISKKRKTKKLVGKLDALFSRMD